MELLLWTLVVGVAALSLAVARRTPRSDRDWAADHARPARATFLNGGLRIHDLRDFRHAAGGAFVERYLDFEIELTEVVRLWLVLAPFARPRLRPLAHTFVSFELAGGRYVAVSIEARREVDEVYSLVGGLLRRFEITYVIGTERDLVGLRALRGDTLHLYPSRASAAQARTLFRAMLVRANEVRDNPEFYHTFTNNCATNLRAHINQVTDDPLPWGWGVLFPGLLDRMALDHGLLDTTLALPELRVRHRVDLRAAEALGQEGEDFSARIRVGLPSRPLTGRSGGW